MTYVPLLDHTDYEMLNEHPFTIRRKRDHYVLTERFNTDGYPCVALNGKPHLKHRLIAQQFVPNDNPEARTQVDHINHDRTDYHLINLRWVTSSDNNRNKVSHRGVVYQYIDVIPDDAMVVTSYDTTNGHHDFENYYYHENVFYHYNGIKYRVLHVNEDKRGNQFVAMRDVDNKLVMVYYSKYKRQHDLT